MTVVEYLSGVLIAVVSLVVGAVLARWYTRIKVVQWAEQRMASERDLYTEAVEKDQQALKAAAMYAYEVYDKVRQRWKP